MILILLLIKNTCILEYEIHSINLRYKEYMFKFVV